MLVHQIQQIADYVRYLSLLSVERARSGHPGLPLGCAELGTLLYTNFFRGINQPRDWINRDRFILSAGHGSLLLYSLEYIFRSELKIEDFANFRKAHSLTPGHPELGIGCRVETSTGPLGQGFSNAVGMALEGKILQERLGKGLDYKVCVLMGDGCIMEGITYESASLAGHWNLDNLIAIYDKNKISIDGETDITLSEDVFTRFIASGWNAKLFSQENIDEIIPFLNKTRINQKKPTLLIVSTTIGNGLDMLSGKNSCHGAPVGLEEITYCIQNSSILEQFNTAKESLKEILNKQIQTGKFLPKFFLEPNIKPTLDENNSFYEEWKNDHSKIYKELENFLLSKKEATKKTREILKKRKSNLYKNQATRDFFFQILQEICSVREDILIGSADLASSTKVFLANDSLISRSNFKGKNIAFGTREHAMSGICNGISIGGRFWSVSSTFLSFLDYMKPGIRLSALMQVQQIYVFSHDSLAVGEDGPTHQPVEQIASLRLIPNFLTFRPSNQEEVAFSFLYLLEKNIPGAVVTSRQKLAEFEYQIPFEIGYKQFCSGKILVFSNNLKNSTCRVIFCSTGSEVGLCIGAAKKLESYGIESLVYSITSFELLQREDPNFFTRTILECNDVKFGVMVEAGNWSISSLLLGNKMRLVDVRKFGFSAPGEQVLKEFGICEENLVHLVCQWSGKNDSTFE